MEYKPDVAPPQHVHGPTCKHGHSHGHAHGQPGGADAHRAAPPDDRSPHIDRTFDAQAQSIQEKLADTGEGLMGAVDWSTMTTRDASGFLPVHFAALKGKVAIIRRLAQLTLEKGQAVGPLINDCENQRKQTPLHWACTKNELAAVIVLLELGADPNVADIDGYTPILTAIQYNSIPIVHFLSEHGGRLDALDTEGHSAMHWAAYFGHERLTEYLLVRGLSTLRLDKQGRTPFHWAALRSNPRSLYIMACSLKDQARFDAAMRQEDTKGCTPIYYAHNNKQPDEAPKLRTQLVVTQLELLPNSALRWVWRAEFAAAWFATFWVPFLLYWWRVLLLGEGSYGVFEGRVLPLVVTAALVFFFVKAGRRLLPRAYDKESPMYLGNIVGIVSLTEVAYFGYLLPNLYDQWILWHLAAISFCMAAPYYLWKTVRTPPVFVNPTPENSVFDFKVMPTEQFCGTCLIRRPLRAKHCRFTNQCVAKYDHFCPWMNQAIGHGNHHLFVAFLFFATVGLAMVNVTAVVRVWHNPAVRAVSWNSLPSAVATIWFAEPFLCIFLVFGSVYLFALLALLSSQINAAMYDVTTNELSNRHRYGYVQYPGTTPWSEGSVLRNLAVFFGWSSKAPIDWTRQYNFSAAATSAV